MKDQLPLEGLRDYRPSQRAQMVQALAELRQELQQMEKGKSLLEVNVPVGLLLADVADKLELSSQERHAFLGGKLCNEVEIVKDALKSELSE